MTLPLSLVQNPCPLTLELDSFSGARSHELRRSAEEYIATTNLTGDLIGKVDEQGRWVFLNDAACQFYGKPREELLGADSRAHLHPDDAARTVQAVQEAAATREPISGFVNRQATPMGTRVVEWNASPFFDEEGRYAGIQMTGRDITERKRAEDLRRQAEQRHRDLFEEAPVMYLITRDQGGVPVVADCNELFLSTLGYARGEVLGRPLADFYTPESRAQLLEGGGFQRALKGQFVAEERQLLARDGRVVETLLRAMPETAPDGRVSSTRAMYVDITDRKQAEQALRHSEERYRDLVENINEIIYAVDNNGFITYISPVVEQLGGYSPSEVIGRSVTEFIHPDDLVPLMDSFQRTVSGNPEPFEYRVLSKSGEIHWVRTFSRPVFEGDRIVGLRAVLMDITDRKRAEEALRESEEKYRRLVEDSVDGIAIVEGFNIRFVNRALLEMYGAESEEEMVGRPFTDFVSPEHRKLMMERAQARQEGQDVPAQYEFMALRNDGTDFPAEISVSRISYRGRVALQGIVRDITERKKAEQERERLHAELELRAITDSLTGLYDHAHFYQRLAEELERAKRYNHSFAVVMLDVDNFKRFNDSRGHQVGDEMLRLVGDCIRSGLRRSDLAFRYGGDEFAAILPHADSSKARAVVNRINRRITKSLKQRDHGAAARLSLSAGVACFPSDGTTADALVRVADATLYSAKWIARARDLMGQREDIQSFVSALVSRRAGVEAPAGGAIFRPEALHEEQARIVSGVASSIAVALRDAGVAQALEDPDLQIVALVGAAAEIKDRYIRGHPERTSELAVALAEKMGLPPERLRAIRIAGLLHDVGKVTVSEGILNKPDKLTRSEFATVKDHPIVGATLVSQVRGFEQVVPIIRHHHERLDGRGYPDGLAGEGIPLEARILSVVDVFDALTHERTYRKALSNEEAITELERGAGTQFDPAAVGAFVALVSRRGEDLAAPARTASEGRQLAAARAPRRRKR